MEIRQVLRALISHPGVSGCEGGVASFIREEFSRYADEVRVDKLGNVVALRRGEGGGSGPGGQGGGPPGRGSAGSEGLPRPRVMLAAHLDQVGLVVTAIEKGGFLRCAPVGGVDPRTLPGQEVVVYGRRPLLGVVGSLPPHVQEPRDQEKAPPYRELFLDLGRPEEEVRRAVAVGDVALVRRELVELAGEVVAGRAFDDRAGVAVLLLSLEELARLRCEADVYAVATVQEEVGTWGAMASTYGLIPDVGVVVDATFGDVLGVLEGEAVNLGKGPALGVGPHVHPRLFDRLLEVAKQEGIPYQIEPSPTPYGTDAWAIQVAREGVPTCLVSFPVRYMHTSVETLHLDDLRQAGRLLARFVAGLTAQFVEGLRCF